MILNKHNLDELNKNGFFVIKNLLDEKDIEIYQNIEEAYAYAPRASFLGTQEGFKMDFKMKRSWEGLGVILANLGGLVGSFSGHFGDLGGS